MERRRCYRAGGGDWQMMLLSRAFAMRSHEANSGGWAYFGREGRGDGRAVNIAGGVGRYRWACRGGVSGRAHAAHEGIFRVKGTDVKDDASRLPPTFYTTALRPCAANTRASHRV